VSRGLYFPRTHEEVNGVLQWVANTLEERPDAFREPYGYALVDDEKGIVAGFLLHDYTGANISFSTAIVPGTIISPRLAANVMDVAFREPLNAERITAFVDSTNMRSVRLIEAMGFTREGCIRRHFGDRDAFVYGLLKDEFYGGRYGRRINRQAGRISSRDAEPSSDRRVTVQASPEC
jgi:RimJ/RimL family protein N-acetyltransferase